MPMVSQIPRVENEIPIIKPLVNMTDMAPHQRFSMTGISKKTAVIRKYRIAAVDGKRDEGNRYNRVAAPLRTIVFR